MGLLGESDYLVWPEHSQNDESLEMVQLVGPRRRHLRMMRFLLEKGSKTNHILSDNDKYDIRSIIKHVMHDIGLEVG